MADSLDPDQIALLVAVWSDSTLFTETLFISYYGIIGHIEKYVFIFSLLQMQIIQFYLSVFLADIKQINKLLKEFHARINEFWLKTHTYNTCTSKWSACLKAS